MGLHRSRPARRGLMAALAIGALLSVSACGSDSGDESTEASATGGEGGSCTLPGEVKVAAIQELTGPAAFAGLSAQKGVKLAMKEINERGSSATAR